MTLVALLSVLGLYDLGSVLRLAPYLQHLIARGLTVGGRWGRRLFFLDLEKSLFIVLL
jgi:hypothetical protein